MAIDLQTAFATVVHEDDGTTFARLETAFASVVHGDDGTTFARLETAFSSVISEQPATVAVISNTPATGSVATPFTFIGSSSVANTWEWSFTAVPAGSAFPVGQSAFPDSGATTPIDMTDNEVLYHANETSGTTGIDTSGNANNATLTSITVNQPGQIDAAWEQAANTSVVSPGTSVTVGTDWTLSFWYYNIGTNSYPTIAFGDANRYHAIVNTTTNDLGVWNSGFRDSGADIVRGETVWRHMAIVGTGGDTLFYMDGVLAGTVVGHQITVPVVSLMNRVGGFTYKWAERVDEIAIWSRALSSTEIADIFILQSGVYATTEDFTFTPDVTGTYDVNLNVVGRDGGEVQTDSATGTLTVTPPLTAFNTWATVIHTATPTDLTAQNVWATVIHTATSTNLTAQNAWATVLHTTEPVLAVISNTPGAGTVSTPFTFIGSNSTGLFYSWTITSKPVGSGVGDPIPLPDNGATTPFDMTNNAVLYHLDGNANDTSGNTQNGTEVGSPTYTTGQIGQAISLDGTTGQYVSVPNSPTVTITGNMSIAAWVNMDLTGDGFQRIVGKATGGSGFGGYALYVNTNGQPRVAFGGTQTTTAATGLITASTWHHVAGTWDGSTARVYVDGVLVDSLTSGSGPGSSTADLHIGADPAFSGTRDFKGLLDEVAIWSRTLSDSEIADLYTLQITGFAVDEANLTFTPDLSGTYDVQLDVSGYDDGGFSTDTALGTLVVTATSSGLVRLVGEDLRPLIGLFATRRKRDS